MTNVPNRQEEPATPHAANGNGAVLTEAVRQVDVIHTSLAGMTAIVITLLAALALPVFGRPPVTHPAAFWVMAIAAFVGIVVLYVLNIRVHKHITQQARLTEVLVNSLGQAFVVFGPDGVCGSVYSQACLDLLETAPAGQKIMDVLRIPSDQQDDFKDWLEVLFQPDHALSFDDVVNFFPKVHPHHRQRRVTLVYRPIYNQQGALISVVVIATDQTEEYAARQAAKKQQNFAEMICRIFKDRNQFQTTLSHMRDLLKLAETPDLTRENASTLLRELHTLKAALKHFNLLDFSRAVHEVENDLRDPSVNTDELFRARVAAGRQKLANELAIVTDEVSSLIGTEYEWRGNVREIGEDDIYAFADELTAAKVDPSIVRDYLQRIAAVPIRDCFHAFERELRELAGVMDKQVKPLKFTGGNPHVLTRPIQELLFSFTHLCRNIMDHGIETPVTRMARGKDPAGQIAISCDVVPSSTGDGKDLRIVISDDGNGIDPQKVRTKMASLDPEGSWRFEDDQAVIQRIFSWGFTTRDAVTDISGRGVGMEAIDREIKGVGGTIRVSSQLYKGASFEMRIPSSVCMAET